jgi:hypothetical protein
MLLALYHGEPRALYAYLCEMVARGLTVDTNDAPALRHQVIGWAAPRRGRELGGRYL